MQALNSEEAFTLQNTDYDAMELPRNVFAEFRKISATIHVLT